MRLNSTQKTGGGNIKKIAVFNNKGGVGKSTIAVQISHGLAKLDYKVLLIDLDSQNNSALYLGIDKEDFNNTFFHLIDYRHPEPLENCIIKARKNLDLLPNSNFENIVSDFHRERQIDTIMEKYLYELEEMKYDYVIFDCSPKQSIVNDAILFYVNNLIVPVLLDGASVQGVSDVIDYIMDLELNISIIKMIVPNQYDPRNNEDKENLKALQEIFENENKVSKPIRKRVKIKEACGRGKTIFEYDKKAQSQFEEVLERVMDIG
ncbi:MAG: ParA family protein [archaeon]